MAGVVECLVNECVQLLSFHAQLPKLYVQADPAQKIRYESNGALVGIAVRTSYYVETASNAHAPVKSRFALRVEFHHRRQT